MRLVSTVLWDDSLGLPIQPGEMHLLVVFDQPSPALRKLGERLASLAFGIQYITASP